jgi:fumarylacetoacetase
MPLGYNGRASSVIVSGQDVKRPSGIIRGPDGPIYSASQKLDYEVEMGMFISQPVGYDSAVPATLMPEHVFGFVLLNDWSARDIQFYEMSPLGPFLGKAGATSISPWIVTLDALGEAGALLTPNPEQEIGQLVSPLLRPSQSLFANVHSFVRREFVPRWSSYAF